MANKEVVRYQNRLDHLFTQIRAFDYEPEVQAHWARYLCVLVSGYLETSVRAILSEYVRDKAHENIARFVSEKLDDLRNPKMGKILDLVRAFNLKWGADLEAATKGRLWSVVDSIVDNRNHIAHGQHSGISYALIKQYYEDAKKVVEVLDSLCSAD